jgi:hypothetical protein
MAIPKVDTPGVAALEAYQNNSFVRSFQISYNGTPVNFTGRYGKFTIKASAGVNVPVIFEGDTVDGVVSVVTSTVTITVESVDVASLPMDTLVWDLYFTDANGEDIYYLEGTIKIKGRKG